MTYPERTSTELLRSPHSTVDVLREYCSRKTVHAVVRLADDIVVVLELDHNSDWAEDLLLDDLHLSCRLREDRGLDEVALRTPAGTAEVNGRASFPSGVDVAHDAL